MTNDKKNQALQILDTMTQAMSRRDANGFAAVYAEDIVVWHNNDRLEQTKAENIASLTYIMSLFVSLTYLDIRRTITETGAVQQHLLQGVLPGGKVVEMPACLILEIAAGKITRIDEYLDPTPFLTALTSTI